MKSESFGRSGKDADRWGFKTTSMHPCDGQAHHQRLAGHARRAEPPPVHAWRMSSWHVLHRRIPHYSWRTLTDWFVSGRPAGFEQGAPRYYLRRTRIDIEILEANELIPRTSEQALASRGGLLFRLLPRLAVQGRVHHVPHRQTRELSLGVPSRKQVGSPERSGVPAPRSWSRRAPSTEPLAGPRFSESVPRAS